MPGTVPGTQYKCWRLFSTSLFFWPTLTTLVWNGCVFSSVRWVINEFAFQDRRGRVAWVQIPPLPLTSCVAVGKSLHLEEPQFHLKNEQNSCLSERLWRFREIMHVTCLALSLTFDLRKLLLLLLLLYRPLPCPAQEHSSPLCLTGPTLGHLLQAAS